MRGISRLKKRFFGGPGESSFRLENSRASHLTESRETSAENNLEESASVLDGLFEDYRLSDIVDIETDNTGGVEKVILNNSGRELSEELYRQLMIEASFKVSENDEAMSDFEIVRETLKEKYAFYKKEMQSGRITKNELTAIRRLFQSIRAKMQMDVAYALASKQQDEPRLSFKDALKLARKTRQELIEGSTPNAKSEFVLDLVQDTVKSGAGHGEEYETVRLLAIENGRVRLSMQGKELAQSILDKALSMSVNEAGGERLQKAKEIIDMEFLAILNDSAIDEIDKRAYRRIRQSVVARLAALAKKEGAKLNVTHVMTEAGRVSEEQQALFLREASKAKQELSETMQTEIASMETEAKKLIGRAYALRSEGDVEEAAADLREKLPPKRSFRDRISGFGRTAAKKGLKLAYLTSTMIAIAGTLASSSHIEVSAKQVADELRKSKEQGIVLALDDFNESGPVYDQPQLQYPDNSMGDTVPQSGAGETTRETVAGGDNSEGVGQQNDSERLSQKDQDVVGAREMATADISELKKQLHEVSFMENQLNEWKHAGFEVVSNKESGELLLIAPETANPIYPVERYRGKATNARLAAEQIMSRYQEAGLLRPGQERGLIRDRYLVITGDNSPYVDTHFGFGGGVCWTVATLGRNEDEVNKYSPIPIFEFPQQDGSWSTKNTNPKHTIKHPYRKGQAGYATYTPLDRRGDPRKWDPGYTVYEEEPGVPGWDYRSRINPDLARAFPGYEVLVEERVEYHPEGDGGPERVVARVIVHLKPKGQMEVAKKDIQEGTKKALFALAERFSGVYKPEAARFAQGIVVGTPTVEQDSTFVKNAGRIERLITSEEATASFRAKRPTFYALGEWDKVVARRKKFNRGEFSREDMRLMDEGARIAINPARVSEVYARRMEQLYKESNGNWDVFIDSVQGDKVLIQESKKVLGMKAVLEYDGSEGKKLGLVVVADVYQPKHAAEDMYSKDDGDRFSSKFSIDGDSAFLDKLYGKDAHYVKNKGFFSPDGKRIDPLPVNVYIYPRTSKVRTPNTEVAASRSGQTMEGKLSKEEVLRRQKEQERLAKVRYSKYPT